jgi:MFS family permease
MKKLLGLPRNVVVLGMVSLFMDVSSEMIYPLIPLFLNNVLLASKTYIGLIEGVAESTASVLKVFSGWLSDKLGKRKSIILWGYGISVFSRPILATATSWLGVLTYRFTDRLGKGVRTAPRDAIIADSTEPGSLGKAFGFHRSMDTVGAVIGPALAFLILALTGGKFQTVFWISMVPGFFALACIAIFVSDTNRIPAGRDAGIRPSISFGHLEKDFKAFLVVVTIFTLGRTSEAFLVLRAQDLGITVTAIPILYLFFNIVAALLSTPAGILSDRIGKRRMILLSYVFFAVIFLGFAFATSQLHGWLLFLAFGVFVAMNEGVQRAYVATVIKPEIMATGYGIYHTIVGLAALPSAIIGGALWEHFGAQALFFYGAAMALLASLLLTGLLRNRTPINTYS